MCIDSWSVTLPIFAAGLVLIALISYSHPVSDIYPRGIGSWIVITDPQSNYFVDINSRVNCELNPHCVLLGRSMQVNLATRLAS